MTGYVVTRIRNGQTYRLGAINISDTTRDDHPFVMPRDLAVRLSTILSDWDDGAWIVEEVQSRHDRWRYPIKRRDGS